MANKAKATKNAFKDHAEFRKEIASLLTRYQTVWKQTSDQTHTLFELSMIDGIIKYFEKFGFAIKAKKTKNQEFIFALSPSAKPTETSYFQVAKMIHGQEVVYDIRHNVRLQSPHDKEIYFSADYSVSTKGSLVANRYDWYYNGKVDHYSIASENLVTFAEAKNYTPSPELVLNFMGIVNEYFPGIMNGKRSAQVHTFTPTLFIAGAPSPQVEKIQKSLRNRYRVNILFRMFQFPTQLHSKAFSAEIESF